MKKVHIYLLDFINFIISFLICRWFFMSYLYHYFINFFGFPAGGVDFWRPLSAILIMTIVLFTIGRLLYVGKLDTRLVRLNYVFYFLVLTYSLLFKNVGLQGINLNLLIFIKDSIFIDPVVLLINILIFIPLGALFSYKYKYIGLFILTIILLEAGQYLFSLGFFDVGDIVTNTVGFVIGNLIHDSVRGKKVAQKIKR